VTWNLENFWELNKALCFVDQKIWKTYRVLQPKVLGCKELRCKHGLSFVFFSWFCRNLVYRGIDLILFLLDFVRFAVTVYWSVSFSRIFIGLFLLLWIWAMYMPRYSPSGGSRELTIYANSSLGTPGHGDHQIIKNTWDCIEDQHGPIIHWSPTTIFQNCYGINNFSMGSVFKSLSCLKSNF